MRKKIICLAGIFILVCMVSVSFASAEKLGSIDIRRAFYEYEKSKEFDANLTKLTEERGQAENEMVKEITKMREELDILSDAAKAGKQKQIDSMIAKLNDYRKETKQEILDKRNEMFKEVIDDIQGVVNTVGEADGYDFIMDSRYIMFAKKGSDITDKVLEQLNK
ncbi:MAG: OmpH family outer membrane protein [Candidatus Omnitrophica bacterium]|nr:OmpH family outer membrane protein [Candidatus Omnitrophota bacterium]